MILITVMFWASATAVCNDHSFEGNLDGDDMILRLVIFLVIWDFDDCFEHA